MNDELKKHVEAVYQLLTQYAQDPHAAALVNAERARLEAEAANPDMTPEKLTELRFRALKLMTFMKAIHSYATWRQKLAKRKRKVQLRLARAAGKAPPAAKVDPNYECEECGLQGWEVPMGATHAEDCPNFPKEPGS